MSVQLVIANIALATASVARQDFGTILFAANHNYWPERVKTFTSLAGAVEEGVPTDSATYKALRGAFSQIPRPSFIKIGRVESSTILTPDEPAEGLTYSLVINSVGQTEETVSYAAVALDTQEEVATALKAAIDGSASAPNITATVVGTGADAKLELTHTVSGNWFTASSLVSLTQEAGAATETAAEVLTRIEAEDDNFYYFAAEEKSQSFVEAMAEEIEARYKFYRVSLDEVDAYASVMTGTFKTLIQDNTYFRTYPEYHHLATSDFPEVGALAEYVGSTQFTGRTTFANRIVAGLGQAKNADGNDLTASQVTNLRQNKVNFYDKVRTSAVADPSNPSITVGGYMASGELALNIPARDNMQNDLESSLTELLIRQKTSRLSYDDKSLNLVRSEIKNILNQYANENLHDFIEKDFVITIARAKDIIAADKSANVLRQVTFKATLKSAIHMIEITGTLGI